MFLYGERVWVGSCYLVSNHWWLDVTAFICSIIITTTLRIVVYNVVVYMAWNNPVSFLVFFLDVCFHYICRILARSSVLNVTYNHE